LSASTAEELKAVGLSCSVICFGEMDMIKRSVYVARYSVVALWHQAVRMHSLQTF